MNHYRLFFVLAAALSASTAWALDDMARAAIEARLKPIGEVTVGGNAQAAAPAAPRAARSGKEVVQATCAACHATGAIGAPKIGSHDDWAPRMANGIDALVQSAIRGKGAMPPRGGGDYGDDEIRAAIEEMLQGTGLEG